MVEHSAVNRRVVGSSPTRGVIYLRLRGQEVKTSPFHGGNTGSIPVGVTFVPPTALNVRFTMAAPIVHSDTFGVLIPVGVTFLFYFGPLAQLVRATGS